MAAPRKPQVDMWDRRGLRLTHPVIRQAVVRIPGIPQARVDVLFVSEKTGSLLVDFGRDSSDTIRWCPAEWEIPT